MTDTSEMAERAFDEAAGLCLSAAKAEFVRQGVPYFSDETHESICHKARLVRDMMADGIGWTEATDHPDVVLCSDDRRYVRYLLTGWECGVSEPLTLDEYRYRQLVGAACEAVRRAIRDAGVGF